MKKILVFMFRGEIYEVNEQGHIKANGLKDFSPTWVFLGGSRHHWSNHIDVTLKEAFEMPGLLDRCLGWDKDHGTTRRWGGRYYGKLPRIRNVYVLEQ
jgi:hypothetical protein